MITILNIIKKSIKWYYQKEQNKINSMLLENQPLAINWSTLSIDLRRSKYIHAYIEFAVRINCWKRTWSQQLATFATIAISVEGNTYFCIGMRSQVSWATACPSSLEAPYISLYLPPRNPFSPIRPTIACCSRSRAGWTQERCKHAYIQDWWVIDSLRKAMRSLSRGRVYSQVGYRLKILERPLRDHRYVVTVQRPGF